jgi:sulfate adenylyltransferase subunit 1 (EFTu-like GTPase family)
MTPLYEIRNIFVTVDAFHVTLRYFLTAKRRFLVINCRIAALLRKNRVTVDAFVSFSDAFMSHGDTKTSRREHLL